MNTQKTSDTPIRCALYLRISTAIQDLESQEVELRRCAAMRGWIVSEDHVYRDVISGTKGKRQGLDRMLEAAARKEFDAVLVVKVDRLARSLQHFARIIGALKKADVALVIPGQGIDTTHENSVARVQMGILAVIAEFERDIISERTKAGLAVVKARGTVLGHPSKVLVADWRERVTAWLGATGGSGLRKLRIELGGVSLSTAAKLRDRVASGK